MRHGGHQGAQKSTRTGTGLCSTSRRNVSSSTSSGAPERSSGRWHRPHFGPASRRSERTRLMAPHEAQWKTSSSMGPNIYAPEPPGKGAVIQGDLGVLAAADDAFRMRSRCRGRRRRGLRSDVRELPWRRWHGRYPGDGVAAADLTVVVPQFSDDDLATIITE